MNCKCKEWKKGMEKIYAQNAFCAIHTGGPEWEENDPVFKFCPWCGTELKRELMNECCWKESP